MRLAIPLLLVACTLPDIRDCPCAEGWFCQTSEMRCVRDTGPVAHYTCDALVGAAMVDASGNGHDARCDAAGCPALVEDPEREGLVCSFADLGSDTGQRLRVSHDDDFVGDAFTVALWANPSGARSGSAIGKPYSNSRANSWQMFFVPSGDDVEARFVSAFCPAPEDDCPSEGGETLTGLPGTAIPANAWSHFAIVWDGTTQYAYVDGMQTESAPGDIDFDVRDITIGADENTNMAGERVVDLPFAGMLDDIRLYDRALDADEIRVLAAAD